MLNASYVKSVTTCVGIYTKSESKEFPVAIESDHNDFHSTRTFD